MRAIVAESRLAIHDKRNSAKRTSLGPVDRTRTLVGTAQEKTCCFVVVAVVFSDYVAWFVVPVVFADNADIFVPVVFADYVAFVVLVDAV